MTICPFDGLPCHCDEGIGDELCEHDESVDEFMNAHHLPHALANPKSLTAMEAVRAASDALTQADLAALKAKRELHRAVLDAYDRGNDAPRIGHVLGLTRQRAWQIIDSARKEAV
jgi:hypothetical protein